MKSKWINKKLLLGLCSTFSLITLTPTISCSKKPNKIEPKDGKHLLKLKNYKFNWGNDQWTYSKNLIDDKTIDFLDISNARFFDANGNHIYYKVKLNVNANRMVSSSKTTDITKNYDPINNFFKKMKNKIDLEFVFWQTNEYENRFSFQPLWKDGHQQSSLYLHYGLLRFPITNSFGYYDDKYNIISFEFLEINIDSQKNKLELFMSRRAFNNSSKEFDSYFQNDAPEVNLWKICDNKPGVNNLSHQWKFNDYYRNLSGTITIEQDNHFKPENN